MATLQRDLGIVLINAKKTKEGQKAFEAAFAADASVTIGKDYLSNAEVAKAWNAAKGSGGTAPTATTPTATASATSTGTKPPPSGGNAEGNLEVKVKEAPIGYPLPVIIDTPEGLDAAALDSCVGAGFYPGIEAGGIAGVPILEPANYVGAADPLRIDASLPPGTMSEFMALPWQADFKACVGHWWPVPRPETVLPQGSWATAAFEPPAPRPSPAEAVAEAWVVALGPCAPDSASGRASPAAPAAGWPDASAGGALDSPELLVEIVACFPAGNPDANSPSSIVIIVSSKRLSMTA